MTYFKTVSCHHQTQLVTTRVAAHAMASPGAGLPSIMRPVKGLVQRSAARASKRGRPSSGKTRFTVILLAILAVAAMVPFMSLSGAAVASASARGPETAPRIFDLGVNSVESARHSVESAQDMIGSMAFWHHDEAAPPLVSPPSTGHCAACHELRVFLSPSRPIYLRLQPGGGNCSGTRGYVG